jgi:hypothetical protein
VAPVASHRIEYQSLFVLDVDLTISVHELYLLSFKSQADDDLFQISIQYKPFKKNQFEEQVRIQMSSDFDVLRV